MTHYVELHRMATCVESSSFSVDDETMERIENKTITREELNELFDAGDFFDLDPLENEYPHTVYKINRRDHPNVYDFEDVE